MPCAPRPKNQKNSVRFKNETQNPDPARWGSRALETARLHSPFLILPPRFVEMNFPPPTPNQARWLWRSLTALSIGVLVFLAMVVLWGLGQLLRTLATVLLPLAIAGIIAYLLDPVVNFFER